MAEHEYTRGNRKHSHSASIDSASEVSGMPRGRGQKGGRPKRQRTRMNLPPPDNYASHPSFLSEPANNGAPAVDNSRGVQHSDQVQSNVTITQSPQVTVTGVHHPLSLSMETHPALLGPSCSFIGSSHSPTYQPPNQVQAPMPFQFQSPLTQFQFPTYSSQSTIGQNTNPFYLKKLSGNIRICQGCRGSLRLANGAIPNPPHDIVVARLEKRQYHDPSGVRKTPAKPSAAHYHPRLSCIKTADPTFVPVSLYVAPDVRLTLSFQHIQLLQVELGINV